MIVLLDDDNRVIELLGVAVGTISQVDVHPRELFREALRRGARSVIVAHNHPSGEVEPSQADVDLTERLIEVGELVGVDVVDSLVVSPTKYYSLAEAGMFRR